MSRFLAAAAAAVIVTAGPAGAQQMGIGTSNPGSIYHSSGTVIAKIANEKAGLKTTVQPFASPNVYIPAVNQGDLQFGLGNVYELLLAVEGREHFAGRPHPDVRAVFVMYPLRIGVFVRKDSPIKTMADLKGKRMPDGYTSQKIILPILDAAYATAGLTRADMVGVRTVNVVAGANDFIAGKVEGFTFALGAAKVQEANAAAGGIRALPIANTPSALAAVRKHLPLAYLRAEQPGPRNPGITEPIYAIAYDALVFANAKTPDDDVYKLVKAIHASKKDLAAAFGPFALFDPGRMAPKIDPIAYHPGAIKFYREQGQWPPKE